MSRAAEKTSAIDIRRISVQYNGRRILRDFSLSLAQGEKLTLTGQSGVGKSTLLRCILGLVPTEQGDIHIAGQPLNERTVWRLRTQLAYVAQEPNLGSGAVRDVLERPFHYKANISLKTNLQRIPELCDRFLLPHHLLNKDITDLSGGEKQRIALISAILLERPIILLDEASSALDDDSKRAVIDYIREVPGLTVLAVAHDDQWREFADRTVQLVALKVTEAAVHE